MNLASFRIVSRDDIRAHIGRAEIAAFHAAETSLV
jgi:hypothetical protein